MNPFRCRVGFVTRKKKRLCKQFFSAGLSFYGMLDGYVIIRETALGQKPFEGFVLVLRLALLFAKADDKKSCGRNTFCDSTFANEKGVFTTPCYGLFNKFNQRRAEGINITIYDSRREEEKRIKMSLCIIWEPGREGLKVFVPILPTFSWTFNLQPCQLFIPQPSWNLKL